MAFSRDDPSPRYRELLAMYREMHLNGERFLNIPASETFDGRSLKRQMKRIKRLIKATGAATLLDYGSGKGRQYDPAPMKVQGEGQWDSVLDYWEIDELTCFDPAYPPHSKRPQGRFDGVISTDVLEHCPEEDIEWIIEDLFSLSEKFVFAAIACHPARKRLPNGENAHCTIREPRWWAGIFEAAAARRPEIVWEAWLQHEAPGGGYVESRLGNPPGGAGRGRGAGLQVLNRLLSKLFRPKQAEPAAQSAPDPVAAQLDAARAHYRAKEFAAAEKLAEEVLRTAPDHLDALMLKADALRRSGRHDAAMAAYRKALVVEPRLARAWLDLGVCHYLKGDFFWARVYYRFANSVEPDNADVWNEFGVVEIALGNYKHAEQSLENAVNRKPEHPEAWNNLGLVMARRGEQAAARRNFLRATFLRPGYYIALCNLGLVCRELELFEEAEKALRRALEAEPRGTDALLNFASLLQDLGRLDDAHAVLEQARAALPADANVWVASSALHFRRGELAAAEQAAKRALECDAGNADAQLALAHVELSQCRFAQGWEHYEARANSAVSPVRKLPFPRWESEDPAGLRLLIYGEQGLGDEILFASCLDDVVDQGARVVLDCDPRLRPLFRRSFPRLHVINSSEDYLGDAGRTGIDRCLAIGSLPRIFRRSEQAFPRRPYLKADAERAEHWRARLAGGGEARLRVGIAWRGGLAKTGREQRSLGIEDISPLLALRGVQWVSLQRDGTAAELAACDGRLAVWREPLADLDETAALMQALDLVVTVCSTVAHLGGALGRRVWVLTPKGAAWRYPAAGDSMPWYPTVTLFRQSRAGEWQDVVASIAQAMR